MGMGDYIVIEEQTGPYEFRACCVSTGTEFVVRIDDDKKELFSDRTWPDLHPAACPFLRPAGNGRMVCSIHEGSPSQCRAFRCILFTVWSGHGERVGAVTGSRALHTTARDLRETWELGLQTIPFHADDMEEQMAAFLVKNGYTIRPGNC
jgi:Fe-S-cluster containining protein